MSESNPSLERLRALGSTPVEELARPNPQEASDRSVNALIGKAEADRHDQANRLRPWFFWSVVFAMAFALVASVAIMLFYIKSEWGEIQSEVMIAWMSSAVVETIGLAYIIATYLFPKPPESNTGATTATNN